VLHIEYIYEFTCEGSVILLILGKYLDCVICPRDKRNTCQLLKANGVTDVRQTEMHTGEPSLLEPSSIEVETAV
jgi:hypothetical protein